MGKGANKDPKVSASCNRFLGEGLRGRIWIHVYVPASVGGWPPPTEAGT